MELEVRQRDEVLEKGLEILVMTAKPGRIFEWESYPPGYPLTYGIYIVIVYTRKRARMALYARWIVNLVLGL